MDSRFDTFLANQSNLEAAFVAKIRKLWRTGSLRRDALLELLHGRSLRGFTYKGIRVVQVLHIFGPLPFEFLGVELSRCGYPSTAENAKDSWQQLVKRGLVAGVSTGRGYIMFALYSDKEFDDPEASYKPLPARWVKAGEAIFRAIKIASERRKPVHQRDGHTSVSGTACGPSDGPVVVPPIGNKKRNRREPTATRGTKAFAYESPELKITTEQDNKFADAFPGIDRQAEYPKMRSWLAANETTRKNHAKFAQNWFSKMKPEECQRRDSGIGGMEIPAAECNF